MWSTYLWAGWALIASFLWFFGYTRSAIQLVRLPSFQNARRATPDSWPTVSILVPARNEAESLESALASLRAQDYPDLEIVVVDDRSTDETGTILDRIAAEDDRIEAVHVENLPEGWLGKVHALHCAEQKASGEWLLLTDADVQHAPDVVRRAVEIANESRADHLACVPRMHSDSFWFQVIYSAFFLSTIGFSPLRKIEDPEASEYMGIGAFNLVRRSILEAAGGFEKLRMEVVDDIGLGQLVSERNGRTRMFHAPDALAVDWYNSLPETVEGFEKNAFGALGHYSYPRVAAISAVWLVLAIGPIAGLFSIYLPVQLVSAAALLLHSLYGWFGARRLGHPVLPFLALYLGHWLMFYVLLNSTYKCWRQGGIRWRDTEYPIDELREQQRVQL